MRVVKHVDFGVYLDGEELGEVLMPIRYVPENCEDGDTVESWIKMADSKNYEGKNQGKNCVIL